MYRLPDLPYGYGDLAPVISDATLRTHHGKHHARYVQVTNELLSRAGADRPLEEEIRRAHAKGDAKLFNNAAQAWNHGFFWACMRPGGAPPRGDLAKTIDATYGGLANLRKVFTTEGAGHFGSGWVWLTLNGEALAVTSTHDAATPLTSSGVTPLLVCDVWEHAYYLDYQNRRPDFVETFLTHLVNWDFVAANLSKAK